MKECQAPFEIKDYTPLKGYPNARRADAFFWECQGCKAKKFDCDLYPDTGLCGSCQFDQWSVERN